MSANNPPAATLGYYPFMLDARWLLIALISLSPALAAASDEFRCEAKGGRAWREIASEHFLLDTDLRSGAARELVQELETMEHAVRHGLFKVPPPARGRIRVVAFDDEDQFRQFAPKGAAAYFTSTVEGPLVVMRSDFAEDTRAVVAHELTHHALARVFARQPLWFSEGMACYLETLGDSGPGVTPTVGGVPIYRLDSVYPYFGGVAKVLLAKGSFHGDNTSYGLSWALVHYLFNARPAEFGNLMGRFQRGQEPDAAWREVFPQWDPRDPKAVEQLDAELGRHVAHGKYRYRTIQLEKDHPVTERPFAAWEAHALRLGLSRFGLSPADASAARAAEVTEALAEDPANVGALRLRAAQDRDGAPRLAAIAVEGHASDPRAWMFLAEVAKDPAAREAAYRKAVELAPDSAVALNDLAWLLVQEEREGEALPLARRAVDLAPWSAPTLDTLAAALDGLGQCAEALLTERRAVDVLPEGATDKGRKPYLDRLTALDAKCGAPPATAPTSAAPATAQP